MRWLLLPAIILAALLLPAAAVAADPPEYTLETGDLLFSDDFKANANHWSTKASQDSQRFFEDGTYRIAVSKGDWMAWSNLPEEYTDFVLQVEASAIEGTKAVYGILFRYQDEDNFYRLNVSSEDTYRFDKKTNGKWIATPWWRSSPSINQDGSPNVLKLVAKGNTFGFYANDTLLAIHVDDTFDSGKIALFAGTLKDGANVQVRFDNLNVWEALDFAPVPAPEVPASEPAEGPAPEAPADTPATSPADTPPPAAEAAVRRLPNGTFIRDAKRDGLGQLTIENGRELDAVAILTRPSGDPVIGIYVQSGNSVTVPGIQDGTYYLYFSLGQDYDSGTAKFTRDATHSRFQDSLVFRTTQVPGGRQYTTFRVTLQPVAGGNASTQRVDPGQFPGLR
ncbi:MAG: hypothetical protein M1531_02010 [Chloroflexi bacterium]|nr:hypothetical protein [Chloroflexota bacterium]